MIVFLIIFLLIICYIDVETKVIGDGMTLLGILVALNYQLFFGNIHASIMGLTAGVWIVWIMNLWKIRNLGGGDAKLMAMIGAFTSWPIVIITATIASILFDPYKKKRKERSIAYAPFITMSFIITLGILWIVKSYLKI